MRGPLLITAAIALSSLATMALAQSAFESSKLSPGIVVEGSGFRSSKLSAGVVLQNTAYRSSKISVGIVLQSAAAFQSSKISTGIVLKSVSGGGGVIPRAPLTHW